MLFTCKTTRLLINSVSPFGDGNVSFLPKKCEQEEARVPKLRKLPEGDKGVSLMPEYRLKEIDSNAKEQRPLLLTFGSGSKGEKPFANNFIIVLAYNYDRYNEVKTF